MLASAVFTGHDPDVRLYELATGRERRRFVGHQANAHALTFSPDGKRLAAGGDEGTILVWDVTGLRSGSDAGPSQPSNRDLATIWDGLADDDASRAYDAMCRLIHCPAQALSFLRERLRPAAAADPMSVRRLLADLDSDEFDVRERASQALGKMGGQAESALNQFLKGNPSAEARKRAERVLAKIDADPTGEALRALRAIEVLEHIGTPEASRLLKSLADGAPEARLTREAKAALQRLEKRSGTAPLRK
jgi:hypothetical protein